MTDFVIFPQPQVKELKLRKTRRRIPKSPINPFKGLITLLFKINLFQEGFFIGYDLFSIQNREVYSLSLIILLLLSTATFGIILLFIGIEDKLTIFSSLTGEKVPPELILGGIAIIPKFIIFILNPSILSEALKYGIYASSSAIIVFIFSFKSTQNNQILITILYLLTVGLSIGMIFQALRG